MENYSGWILDCGKTWAHWKTTGGEFTKMKPENSAQRRFDYHRILCASLITDFNKGSKHLFAVDHGFFRLYVGSQPVSVRKKDLRVNASHIIRACDLSLRITAAIRAEFAFDMEKRGCHPPHQGTYVDYEVGLELCRRYRLFELEEQLLGLKPCLNADAITKTLSQQLARDATSRRRSASFEADQRRDPGISAYEDPVPDHMQEATCGTTDKLTKCDKGSKRSHIGHPDSVLDEDRYSFIVEPSNKYGSFLLPSSWQSRFSS